MRSHTVMDIWVVDVEGTTLVVAAGTRGAVPTQAAGELDDVVESVRFVLPRLIGQTRRTERSTPIFSIRCSGLWNSSDQ